MAEMETNEQVLAASAEAGLQDAKSSVSMFDLPCGYLDDKGVLHREAAVREIAGPEEDMLGGRSSFVKKMSELLVQCTTRIGPYTEKADLRRVIGNLLIGDRVQLLLQIRIVTFGPIYSVYEKCPECGKVGPPFPVDLADLPVVQMADPLKRERSLVLPKSKRPVKVRFMNGLMEETLAADMAKLAKKNPKDPLLEGRTMSLAPRVLEIDGRPATLEDVLRLGMADRQYLYAYFDKEEGGVDTTGEYECGVVGEDGEVCGYQFSAPLKFGDGFFSLSSGTT